MAVASSTTDTRLENIKPEKQLGLFASAIGARYLEQYAYKKQELVRGREVFQKFFLSNYNWRFSDTYFILPQEQIEQQISKIASGLQWPENFTEKVKVFADLGKAKHDEIQVKFCPDTSSGSGCSLHIIATVRDQDGRQHFMVIFAENSFSFAPKVERIILEDKEPVYVTKHVGFQFLWCDFRRETTVLDGYKSHQRVEERVTAQTLDAGDAEKMHDFLIFKMSQAVCRMYPEGLAESPEEARLMLSWGN